MEKRDYFFAKSIFAVEKTKMSHKNKCCQFILLYWTDYYR